MPFFASDVEIEENIRYLKWRESQRDPEEKRVSRLKFAKQQLHYAKENLESAESEVALYTDMCERLEAEIKELSEPTKITGVAS